MRYKIGACSEKSSIVHQRVIHESYSPNKRAIEFQRQKLLSEFREILKRKILQNISRTQVYI